MSLKPLKDQVLVKVEDFTDSHYGLVDGKTQSGIIVAKQDIQGVPYQGVIYAVGDTYFKVGTHVTFENGQARGFRHDGLHLMAVPCKDISAIIKEA